MADYFSFLLSIIWFAYNLSHASASTPEDSEFAVGPMDAATAVRITKLLQRNFDADFSWDDPELAKLLYNSNNTETELASIAKRALLDGTAFGAKIGPLLTFPQCIGCSTKAADAEWTIDDFTVGFFMQTRIVPLSQLRDSCVFYGRRSRANMVPAGLSEPATLWACLNGRKTIWHLWPYNTVNDDGNFWILDKNKNPDTRNWLKNVWDADVAWHAANTFNPSLPNQGPQNIFFSHMSAAVAFSCSGTVYIMAEDVQGNLPRQGIWPLVEYPALQEQHAFSEVTQVIAVPFVEADYNKGSWTSTNNPSNWRTLDLSKSAFQRRQLAYVDLNTLNWTSYLDENGNPRIPHTSTFQERSEARFRDRMDHIHQNSAIERRGLEKRDSCLGGLPFQASGHDYFNDGY